eukprot:642209-Pelagomonas_calceolata.AAC.7
MQISTLEQFWTIFDIFEDSFRKATTTIHSALLRTGWSTVLCSSEKIHSTSLFGNIPGTSVKLG